MKSYNKIKNKNKDEETQRTRKARNNMQFAQAAI